MPDLDPLRAPSRLRLSQFLILPPHQGAAHGTSLLRTITNAALADASVYQFTVEDPNEAFDALRDMIDLGRFRSNAAFHGLTLPGSLPAESLSPDAPIPTHLLLPQHTLRHLAFVTKTAPRQFARVLEIHLLSQIPKLNRSMSRQTRGASAPGEQDRRFYFWRLWVKARLADRNWDLLKDMEQDERVEKIEEACKSVLDEYEGLLEMASRRGVLSVEPSASGSGEGAKMKKRRIVVDDDDEEEESGGRGKTPRIE
jgi:histone acetyltransferase 1